MTPGFPPSERAAMLALKGVGATVIGRLESLGYTALTQLADADPATITLRIARMMGSTCWHNSPQARAAIAAIIALAEGAAP